MRTLLRYAIPAAAVLVGHLVAWKLTDGYERWPWADRLVHVLGGAAVGWLLLAAMRMPFGQRFFGRHGRASEAASLLAWMGLVVVAWEFLEWSLATGGWIAGGRSDDETIADLAMGLLGGALVLLLPRPRIDR